MQETRKIFGEPNLRVSATCVRVPVLRAHCVALTFECDAPSPRSRCVSWLQGAPGVRLVDDRARTITFPMPKDASGQDDVLVGRIRQDLSDPSGRSIALFCAGDQLLKGAALMPCRSPNGGWRCERPRAKPRRRCPVLGR